MRDNTDCMRIVDYMKSHNGITVKECTIHVGTGDLRRRICDLKEKGYTIADQWEDGFNRVGNPTRYKRYFLLKEPN